MLSLFVGSWSDAGAVGSVFGNHGLTVCPWRQRAPQWIRDLTVTVRLNPSIRHRFVLISRFRLLDVFDVAFRVNSTLVLSLCHVYVHRSACFGGWQSCVF